MFSNNVSFWCSRHTLLLSTLSLRLLRSMYKKIFEKFEILFTFAMSVLFSLDWLHLPMLINNSNSYWLSSESKMCATTDCKKIILWKVTIPRNIHLFMTNIYTLLWRAACKYLFTIVLSKWIVINVYQVHLTLSAKIHIITFNIVNYLIL